MDSQARTDTVTQEVSRSLAGTGVVVDDVVVQQAGRRRLVRVLLARDVADLDPADRTSPVAPLSLDEVADATRTVSAALDDSDVMGEAPYTLEVSSSGVDRPLTTPEGFRRNVGRLVRLTLADGTQVSGRLTEAGADGIRLDGADGELVAHDQITQGAVQVEFTRPDGEDH